MTETTMSDRLRRRRRVVLGFLYAAFLLTGAMGGIVMGAPVERMPPDFPARVQLLSAILISLSCMWYCTIDARLAGRFLIQLARIGIFLGWPVGVPIYLVWAHGIRGFGVLLLHGFLLLLIMVSAMLLTGYAIYGDAFFT